ncbi:MAG: hypothetical protein H6618_07645 [Deltaproteobacteria bacterium]|nr:hypothetical protein [Deltaproteobacteria bacterium]
MKSIHLTLACCLIFSDLVSAENCKKYWDRYLIKKEESEKIGGAGTAIAMGAVSFFLPAVGTLAVGAVVAATAALLNEESEKNKKSYYACINHEARKAEELRAEENQHWKEENEKRQKEKASEYQDYTHKKTNHKQEVLNDADL